MVHFVESKFPSALCIKGYGHSSLINVINIAWCSCSVGTEPSTKSFRSNGHYPWYLFRLL